MHNPEIGDPQSIARRAEELKVLELQVEVWKKIVEVQQHFNDIALRLRSMAIPVLVGAIGGAGYVVKERNHLLALGVVIVGAIAWLGFFLMDRYWYHVFLRAAGIHAGSVEAMLSSRLPGIGLSTAIADASRRVEVPRWPRQGVRVMNSVTRLVWFYKLGFIALGLVAALTIALWIVDAMR